MTWFDASTYGGLLAVRVYDPGSSRSRYVPVSSVVAWRPPGDAVMVAPAIGAAVLVSVTTPVTMPVGTSVIRMARFAPSTRSRKPTCRASVPSAFSMPTVAFRPSPGLGELAP